MPDSESKDEAQSGGDGPDSGATSPSDSDVGWEQLLGDSSAVTTPVLPVSPTKPKSKLPPLPGGPPKTDKAPLFSTPAAPPVPGIAPGPRLEKVSPTAATVSAEEEAKPEPSADATPIEELADPDKLGPRVRLPTPGVWGKQAPRDASLDFKPKEDAADFFARARAEAPDAGAPEEVAPQDTQALIAGMAEEIEKVAEAQRVAEQMEAAHKHKDDVLEAQPTIVYTGREARSGMGGWVGVIGSAVAGLVLIIWALLPDGEEATQSESSDEPMAAVAAKEVAEPQHAPEKRPEPEPEPGPEPEPEPEPEPAAETGETGELEEIIDETGELELEDPEPEPEPEPAAATPKKSGGKKSSQKAGKPAPAKKASKPNPKKKKPAPKPKSASELLAAAKKANAAGQGSKAYSLASQSYSKKKGSAAAEQMVLGACKMKSASKARSALAKVKLTKRRNLKQRCKSLGVKL